MEVFDAARTILAVRSYKERPAIVAFGYPPQAIGEGKKNREALSEVTHRERFGQPFE